jgi:1-deoxy-D-xylulose-5-phosphate synthase
VALLDGVVWPENIRKLNREELHALADEVRERHIDVVSEKGGHFGASLGVAELTVALHYVFDTPRDQLVWDTGHQAYIHKILTGRNDAAPDDPHAGRPRPSCAATSRSTTPSAPGTPRRRSPRRGGWRSAATSPAGLRGRRHHRRRRDGVRARLRGAEQRRHTGRDFIVVLNDNDMSIAPAVGAMNKYLTGIITNPAYNKVRGLEGDPPPTPTRAGATSWKRSRASSRRA